MPHDPFSTYSHAIGAILIAIAAIPLIRRAIRHPLVGCTTRPAAVVAIIIFTLSAVTLLSASALYHSLPPLMRAKALFLRLDHAAIFILIAGTFTPLHAIAFRGFMRWGILAMIWSAAIAGVAIKTVFFNDIPYWAGITAYLLMGWGGALSMGFLWKRHTLRYVSPLILGGLAYSAGALCEFTNQPIIWRGVIQSHEVFHIAVLVGLACHWMFIHRLAASDPIPKPTRPTTHQSPSKTTPLQSA